MTPKKLVLIGERFGKLVVVREVGRCSRGNVLWLCHCDCGTVSRVRGDSLTSGATRSCGVSCPQLLPDGMAAFNLLYNGYRYRAKKRGLDFELSKDQVMVLTKGNCFYCGSKPKSIRRGQTKRSGDYIYNGIDRIVNSKGYTIKNCVSCCVTCNTMKMAMSYREFISHVRKIYNRIRKHGNG